MDESQVVLVHQDTTHLNYSTKKVTKGLGHIGTVHGVDYQGIIMHSALATLDAGECLGLLYEKPWTRGKAKRKIALNAHQNVPFSQNESFKWV